MLQEDFIIAEAWLNHGRRLTPERAAEIADEVGVMLSASRELGARLQFDDQASDLGTVMVEASQQEPAPR